MSPASSRFPRSKTVVLATLLGAAGVVACQRGPAPVRRYAIAIHAETDAHLSLEGVEIRGASGARGKTSAAGDVTLQVDGSEGRSLELEARCPPLHVATQSTFSVTLRRLKVAQRLPVYRVECRPELRTVVVAVRATNGPDLPVVYLGKERARTDSSGVAHLELTLQPGERYELGLDTRDLSLVPKNPRSTFVVSDQDELVFFNQRFEPRKPRGNRAHSRLPVAF